MAPKQGWGAYHRERRAKKKEMGECRACKDSVVGKGERGRGSDIFCELHLAEHRERANEKAYQGRPTNKEEGQQPQQAQGPTKMLSNIRDILLREAMAETVNQEALLDIVEMIEEKLGGDQ